MARSELTQSTPEQSNWNLKKSQIKGMYKLALVDLERVMGAGGITNASQLGGISSANVFGTTSGHMGSLTMLKSSVFLFPVNPKSITFEEPASVTVVALQNGGKYIEHQGSIFKNITISGNSGLRPNRTHKTEIFPVPFSNVTDLFRSDTDTIPAGEETGFDNFIHLRNMFRAYFDAKKDPELAPKTVMVWGNSKEEDYFIVEPISFRTSQDTSSRFTYNYEISLKTLDKIELTSAFNNESGKSNSFLDYLNKVKNITANINKFFSFITSNIDLLGQYGRSIVDTVLSPLQAIMTGIGSTFNSISGLLSLPKDILANLMSNCTKFIRDLGSVRNAAISTYTDFGSSIGANSVISAFKGLMYDVAALTVAQREAAVVWTTVSPGLNEAYNNPQNDFASGTLRTPNTASMYRNKGGTSFSRPVSRQFSAARQSWVNGGDDIYRVALRETNDAGNWKDIVTLNNLEAPYISETGDGVRVLRPGDPILIPSTSNSSSNDISGMFTGHPDLTPAERALGTDFKLFANQPFGNDFLYDIKVMPTGDVALVRGMENMEQAMTILFATDIGELRVHPQYGVAFPIGTKGELHNIVEFKLHTKAVILRDSRVADVPSISYRLKDNVLYVNANIKLKSISELLSTSINTRI